MDALDKGAKAHWIPVYRAHADWAEAGIGRGPGGHRRRA